VRRAGEELSYSHKLQSVQTGQDHDFKLWRKHLKGILPIELSGYDLQDLVGF
jgi:hypothetical protein